MKVLVEGEANAKQLQNANVSSWEHGLMRESSDCRRAETEMAAGTSANYLIARGEADAPDIDGRVYVRGGKVPSANSPGSRSSATRIMI